MPQAIVRLRQTEIVQSLNTPDIKAKLTGAGFLVFCSTPEELAAAQKSDIEQAAKIVKAAGIQPE